MVLGSCNYSILSDGGLCNWKYEEEYSVYNFPEWNIILEQKWAITIELKRQEEFMAVSNKSYGLCGYIRFSNNYDYVPVGLGLKPSLCGQGLGNKFIELLKNECKKNMIRKKLF